MFFGKSDEVPQKINHPAQVTADGDFATFRPEQPGVFAGQTAGVGNFRDARNAGRSNPDAGYPA